MRDLELADDGGGSIETDILIGADLYWLFVDGEVKKKRLFRFGGYQIKVWLVGSFELVSGPVPRVNSANGFTKSYLSTTHLLCLQNVSDAEAMLSEEVKKIWDLNSVGIRGYEVSAYEKHAS